MNGLTHLTLPKACNHLPATLKLVRSKPGRSTLPVFSTSSLDMFSKVYPKNNDNEALSTSTKRLQVKIRALNDYCKKLLPLVISGVIVIGIISLIALAGAVGAAVLGVFTMNPAIPIGFSVTLGVLSIGGMATAIGILVDKLQKRKKLIAAQPDILVKEQTVIKTYLENHGVELKKKLEDELAAKKLDLEKLENAHLTTSVSSLESPIQKEIQLINQALLELGDMTKLFAAE